MFDRPLDLMMFLVGAGLLVIQDELSDIHSRLYIVLLGALVLAVVKQSAYAMRSSYIDNVYWVY